MAKMIPQKPSEDTSSNAEKKLFQIFSKMPDTDNWVVFHSLAIAKHATQSQGEADFVVVIPNGGVFTLEVKGGGISCFDGKWHSTDRYGKINTINNPINEANRANHSIKNYLKARSQSDSLKLTLFGFGVVFPDTTMHGNVASVEIADEQIADYDDCLTPVGMREYLMGLAHYWKKRFTPPVTLPNEQQCKELVSIFRPDFEGKISLRSIIHTVENQVVELTENQQDIFETIMDNSRCVVRGNAGTGKTIIALHFARQQAELNQKVGFFCYNKQLSWYLNSHVDKGPHLICDSFTEYMEAVVQKAGKLPALPNSTKARNQYYSTTLPEIFMEAFVVLEEPQFDCLIFDEAQDLLTSSYIEAMDLVLKNGIQGGRWYFFMDAEKQNLFHRETTADEIYEILKLYGAYFTECKLRDNCRNSVAIIEKIDSIFNMETRHRHNEERGAEVSIKTYRKQSDAVDALESILRTLNRESISSKDIAILSPVRFQNSSASLVSEFDISTDTNRDGNAIFYSTIQSFKGLESPVVIITDIVDLSNENKKNILYVGMTRAKSVLYIIASDKAGKFLRS